MVDNIDRLTEMDERHLRNAQQAHAQRTTRPGLSHCESVDCATPISAQRQSMGARLCMECATAEEAAAAHFRKWSW